MGSVESPCYARLIPQSIPLHSSCLLISSILSPSTRASSSALFPYLCFLFPYSRPSIILVERTSFGAFTTIRTQRIFIIIIQYNTIPLLDWLSCLYHHVSFSFAGTGFGWRLYTYNLVHVFMLCDPLYYVIDVSVTNIITFCRPSSLE